MRWLFTFVSVWVGLAPLLGQTIELHSISFARQPYGDNGYTLDGQYMNDSRSKLLHLDNFGPTGRYPKSVQFTTGYAVSGSLTTVPEKDIDILFFGSFISNSTSFAQLTEAELDSLYNWSKKGGKMIIASQPDFWTSKMKVLDDRWGFERGFDFNSTFIPTTEGSTSLIFDGPFGTVQSAAQGGASRGYFQVIPQNSIVLAEDYRGGPTLILDCNTLDLICAEVDGYTSLGGITPGIQPLSTQDAFWLNTIAYVDQIEDPSVISANGDELSTGNYASYQWYLNGNEIEGATSQTYLIEDEGQYTVGVTYFNGCTGISPPYNIDDGYYSVYIPNIFSPNADGNNDWLYVRGAGITKLEFIIYDRWGNRVFETKDIQQGWGGTYEDEAVNSGVFVYSASGEFINGQTFHEKGSVTVVR